MAEPPVPLSKLRLAALARIVALYDRAACEGIAEALNSGTVGPAVKLLAADLDGVVRVEIPEEVAAHAKLGLTTAEFLADWKKGDE